MMFKELLAYPGFHFAEHLLVTLRGDTFKTELKELCAVYGHYSVVEFHVVAGTTEIDSVSLIK